MDSSLETRKIIVGEQLAPELSEIVNGPVLKPGDRAILRRFPIRFTSGNIPDSLVVRSFSGTHLIGRQDIRLTIPAADESYHFPLKGVWQIYRNFDNSFAHRCHASREFAIDLLQLSPGGTIRKYQTDSPDDFICFGQPVHAMDNGRIIKSENSINDNAPSKSNGEDDLDYRKEEYGFLDGFAGNYIIMEHDNQRYSFFAHLRKGSIRKKPGDSVKKGEVIAEVGNSGNSAGAHLHMQLNDGPDPSGSRSLPIYFENIYGIKDEPINLIAKNYLLIHTKE